MTWPLSLSISLLSASIIGYEILLMRLFSIVQWHHFAYMAIGLALLGFGASGSFLSFARHRLANRFVAAFAAFSGLFGLTAVVSVAAAQRVPFNALEIVWDPVQFLYLFAIYLLLAVPFFCGATSIGLALYQLSGQAARVYRADLMGAGLGAAAVVAIMFLFPLELCLAVLGGGGAIAAGLACGSDRKTRKLSPFYVISGVAIAALLPAKPWLPGLTRTKRWARR